MSLIKELGLPEEHASDIIAAAVKQLKRGRNAILARQNANVPIDTLDGEDFVKDYISKLLISCWKNEDAQKAKDAIDAKLK